MSRSTLSRASFSVCGGKALRVSVNSSGQAKVQVLSKLPAGDGLLGPVRGRENAGVALNLLPAPDALGTLLLEKAQELHLYRRRQLTNLVQESTLLDA
jgi:hypothetical protein